MSLEGRFDVGVYGALAAGLAGLAAGSTTAFLLAAVALAFVAYGRVSGDPRPTVAVDRAVEDASPRPGQRVAVTLTVTNEGSAVLPDVRVRDRVPDSLPVVEGSPAVCTSLRPGESETVSYAVRARRGTVRFGDPEVVVRDVTGGAERPAVAAATTLSCRTPVEAIDLLPETLPITGRVETDAAGEGVVFHSVREYERGDSPSRIDWNRFASTNELATIRFRETRAATVLVVVETGPSGRVAPGAGEPTARALGEYAARCLAETLLDNHNHVGVARYGRSCRYLPPGTGHEQAIEVDRFLGGAGGDLIERDVVGTLRKRLPDDAQVIYCSPFLTDDAAAFVERLAAYGHPVTVVSPDVTAGETIAGTVARIERDRRLDSVRGPDVRTVDWTPADPLAVALERAAHGWSR